MPEDITQRLGFDASKAVQELIRLRGELNNFKQSLQSVSGAVRKFPRAAMPAIKTFRELATAAASAAASIQSVAAVGGATQAAAAVTNSYNQASRSMQGAAQAATNAGKATKSASSKTAQGAAETAQALNKAGQAGSRAANEIGISWKTIGRVIQAQVIVRAINVVISSFRDAQQAALEFSVAVAEAFTISAGGLGTMQEMNAGVRELSLTLGSLAGEVAEGVYQTLSNQVVEAGDALAFTRKAGELAIATNSELRSSVNALSSVMNSYGLDVSETGRVADVLFKTIELGRLRMNEFGDVLGRVSPITAALGISYEEMAAAMASLTQKGVPAHTAITQLTQVTQKLLRPTDKLKELYHGWGVETGPEAIRRFGGLQGVLLKMKDATAGNDAAFADLLGRVRAIVAGLNLTSDGASSLDDAMRQMSESTGAADKALEEIRKSSGRKAIEAWNNLGTTMLETGDKLLAVTTPIANALEVVAKNMNAVVTAAAAAGAAFLVLRTSAMAGAKGVGIMTLSLAGLKTMMMSILPIALAAAAAFAGMKLGEWFSDWSDQASKLSDELAKSEEVMSKRHAEESQRRIQSTRREFEERRKLTGDFYAESARLYNKDFDVLQASATSIGKTLDATLSALMKKRQDAIKAVKDAVIEADSAIKSSMEVIRSTQQAISDAAFKRELRQMGARRALWATFARARKTAAEAIRAYAAAGGNEEKAAAARKLSALAESRASEAINAAKSLGNFRALKKAESEVEKIRKARIRGETQFIAERKKLRSAEHKTRIAQLEEEGIKLEVLVKKLRKLADPMTSENVLKSLEQRRADAERIADLVPLIGKQLDAAFDFSMFDRLGVIEGLDQVKVGIAEAFDKASIDWRSITDEFAAILAAREFEAPITLRIRNQAIIEEFVSKFGEIDPLKDPGKTTSQMAEVLEGIVSKTEALHETIDQTTNDSLNAINGIEQRLEPDKWFSGWQRFQAEMKETGPAFLRTGDISKLLAESNPQVEALRQKFIAFTASMKESVTQGEELSRSQKATYRELIDSAKQLEAQGLLGKNTIKEALKSVAALQTVKDKIGEIAAAQKELEAEGPKYEPALKALEEQRAASSAAKKLQEEITGEVKKTGAAAKELNATQKALIEFHRRGKTAIDEEAKAAKRFKELLQGAAKASQQIKQVGEQWSITEQPDVGEWAGGGMAGEGGLSAQVESARQFTAELLTVNSTIAQIISSVSGLGVALGVPSEAAIGIRDSFLTVDQAVRGVSAAMPLITEQLASANAAASNLVTSLNSSATAATMTTQATSSITSSLQSAAAAGNVMSQSMQAAAAAAVKAAQACAKAAQQCSGGNVRASQGGRFFAAGGRGTDTIPAMLTPGEFVINARSARNFFPQLQAINAGQQPIYRDQGGTVTNIGDINVTVQGGEGAPTQTVREIATGLRRELRRKTVKLY